MEFHPDFPSLALLAGTSIFTPLPVLGNSVDAGEFIAGEQTRLPHINYNQEVLGGIHEPSLVSYESWTRCVSPTHRLVSTVRYWSIGWWIIRSGGRREPRKVVIEHIFSKLDILECAELQRILHSDIWKFRCEV